MNILIVDDQPNVISSLLQRVPWQGIGISNVYTANSALAARDVLFSKQVDILLADIEMPQENGLSLVRWIRSKGLEIECILLTSHANFCADGHNDILRVLHGAAVHRDALHRQRHAGAHVACKERDGADVHDKATHVCRQTARRDFSARCRLHQHLFRALRVACMQL